jgi:hypothetical protein
LKIQNLNQKKTIMKTDNTDYLDEENVDRSYNYEGENEATETQEEKEFEEQEFIAKMEDDLADADTPEEKQAIQADIAKAKETFAKNDPPYDEENDGYYGGPKDSEGNLLDREDWPADAEYDNEDETGQLKVDEKGFREYLKDRDIDLDTDYYKYSPDEKKKMEEEYEEQKEDKYRDITTAGEDVEGFERFVEEKKGNDYNFEKDYHWESAEDQSKLEKEFNDMKLKRAGEDLQPSEQIPIKGGPVIVKIKCDGELKNGKCEKDNDKPHKKVVVKKYYRDRDDNNDDNDDDVKDLAAYNMGYRNGKVDKINKMPFNDAFPFDDKDGQTWYKVGYRSGWDSGK